MRIDNAGGVELAGTDGTSEGRLRFCLDLPPEALGRFRRQLAAAGADDLGPQPYTTGEMEYVHLTRDGGRRVRLGSPFPDDDLFDWPCRASSGPSTT